MRKVLYSKYNHSRAPKYQTKTVIYCENDRKYIEKTPANELAEGHIAGFKDSYDKVKNLYPNISVIDTEFGENYVRYPYLNGISLDEYISNQKMNFDEMFNYINNIFDMVLKCDSKYISEFENNAQFAEIFGDVDCKDMVCIKPCNVDLIFDNLMMMENGAIVAFDYEWVFDFAMPKRYVEYRILCHFYDKNIEWLSPCYDFDEYIDRFGFSDIEKDTFRKMEDSFIKHVYTGGEAAFADQRYHIKRPVYKEVMDKYKDYDNVSREYQNTIVEYHKSVAEYQKVLDVLHSTEKEYLLTIDRLNEAVKIVSDLEQQLAATNARLNEMYMAYDALLNSKSWKVTKPIRWVKQGTISLRNNGVKSTARLVVNKLNKKKNITENITDNVAEQGQFANETKVSDEEYELQRNTIFDKNVKISVITPLFNTPEKYLKDMLDSLVNQTYSNWEHCIVNYSDEEHGYVDEICKAYQEMDDRFVYRIGNENKGISENTNECISYATGEYIALLDHDDILHSCALYEVVKAINEQDADFIYTDEIKFEEDITKGFAPNFKPEFSADELRAHNYICHFCVYAKDLLTQIGEYRKEFDGSQDHDIVLRLTECAKKIVHIPSILYFWRVHPGSVASGIEAKSYATDAGAAAVTEQMTRLGYDCYAESVINNIPLYRLKNKNTKIVKVSLIVWGVTEESQVNEKINQLMDKGVLVEKTICITEKKLKFDTDVNIISNVEKTLGNCLNKAMKKTNTEYSLILNANISTLSGEIGDELAIYNNREDICSISMRINNNGHILSGGVYVKDNESEFALRCIDKDINYGGYENIMMHTRNVSASMGIATFIRKKAWEILGGFNDSNDAVLDITYRGDGNYLNNLWVPFMCCDFETHELRLLVDEMLKGSSNIIQKYHHKEMYVSHKVFDYGLE